MQMNLSDVLSRDEKVVSMEAEIALDAFTSGLGSFPIVRKTPPFPLHPQYGKQGAGDQRKDGVGCDNSVQPVSGGCKNNDSSGHFPEAGYEAVGG